MQKLLPGSRTKVKPDFIENFSMEISEKLSETDDELTILAKPELSFNPYENARERFEIFFKDIFKKINRSLEK